MSWSYSRSGHVIYILRIQDTINTPVLGSLTELHRNRVSIEKACVMLSGFISDDVTMLPYWKASCFSSALGLSTTVIFQKLVGHV